MKKLIILIIFIAGIFALAGYTYRYTVPIGPFIDHNFINLDKIAKISKFRSGHGHDFSYLGLESCRSMKHYFHPTGGISGEPHNPSWMSIKYYAPVEGTIMNVAYTNHEYGREAQFHIRSKEYPSIYVAFFHVRLAQDLDEGSTVQAGQLLGTIGHEDAYGEIAVEYRPRFGDHKLLSFFDLVTDRVFAMYQEKGITDKDSLIITRATRDASPLNCDIRNSEDSRFFPNNGQSRTAFETWQQGAENWVFLSK